MKKYILFYIIGGILTFIGFIGIIISLTLPLAIDDFSSTFGWILVLVISLLFFLVIFSVFLLKKANFLRINEFSNKEIAENEAKFKRMLDEKYSDLEKNENNK